MTWDDREYYRNRVRQEKADAARAACPVARDRHLELAELYEQRLRGDAASVGGDSAIIPLGWLARTEPAPVAPLETAG